MNARARGTAWLARRTGAVVWRSLVRIVVTGASGNVGSALLRRLLAVGGHDILGVARRVPDEPGAPFDAVSWRSLDLTEDTATDDLREAFRGADAVVHLAWGFQPSHDIAYLEALGVGGTRRVLEAVALEDVRHVVHMSSVGAYSPKRDDTPVDETWPTGGVPTSPYSRHKSSAERLLDAHESAYPDRVVTRLRPGVVGQRTAGSALLRYALPGLVPAAVLGHLPVLPLDRRLTIPMVHADDVAAAIERVLATTAAGPFNLAAEPAVTTADIADVLGARQVQVPSAVLRAVVSLTWHARLQQVDTGWLDLGFAVPLLDTSRARRELCWTPQVDARTVLAETVAGMREGAADRSPVLRPRSVPGQVARALRHGPVSRRHRP
ncbi:MAG TPA: NAD-dependent epimerase/dehydratase family protein [Nocardioidaceae bacterium]|nr:NAD-dependent epimerase/dehydratase family protein [Nocardioidaceae bacterium]